MTLLSRWIPLAALAPTLTLTGCASVQPHPYASLPSSAALAPNPDDATGHVPYRLAKRGDLHAYSQVMIGDVTVYAGADNQFEDGLGDDDKKALADYMRTAFSQALGQRLRVVNQPGPGTLRLDLALTGAKTNTAFLSTFTRFDLGGGPYNLVQGIRGKEGLFSGSVTYAVDIRDASDGRLLDAFVAKQFPNAMNVSATVGKLAAAKTGIDKGAAELAGQLR